MAKVISVVSGKGGTGKSTVTAQIAKNLSLLGHRCLAVDLDIGLRSLDIMLGIENQIVFDLGDVIDLKCTPEKAIVNHPLLSNLYLLCSPLNVEKPISILKIIDIIKSLKASFDYIILDLPAGLGISVMMTKELADLCLIVTTPEAVTIRDTRKISDVIDTNYKKISRLIINKVSDVTMISNGVFDLDQVIDSVAVQLIGVIPEDKWINASEELKNKHKKSTMITNKVFNAISQRITGQYVPLIIKQV